MRDFGVETCGKRSLRRYMRKWEDNIKMFVLVMICTAISGHGQVTGSCERGSGPSLL